jgi:predicted  nucleic acid-binding Zn-ribbon protein
MPYRPLGLMLAAAVGLTALPALAEKPAGATPAAQEQTDPRAQAFIETRQRMKEIQQQLGKIQQQVLSENEALRKQQEELQNLVIANMREQGVEPLEEMERLRAMGQKLQSRATPAEEKEQLAAEFQAKKEKFESARETAFATPEVKQAAETLQERTLAAMQEEEPLTEELMAEFETKQAELRKMYRKAQKDKAGG